MAKFETNSKESVQAKLLRTPVNANGQPVEYGSGAGDVSLDFGLGGYSFANGEVGSITLQIKSSEAAGVKKKIALNPGWYNSAADIKDENGVALDAIITEAITADITATSSNGTIADFLAYIRHHASTLKEIVVKESDESYLDVPLFYREINPLGASSSDKIIPSVYADEKSPNTKLVTIAEVQTKNWVFGTDSIFYTTISGGETKTITLTFGASNNPFKELKRKNQMGRAFVIRNSNAVAVVD